MHIPILDLVEQFSGFMKPKHTVEHTAEEICTEPQIASPHHTNTSAPTKELLQPEPKEEKEEEKSSDTSAATTTVWHICGYVLLSLSISHT